MKKNINDFDLKTLFDKVMRLMHNKRVQELEKIGLYRGQPPILYMLYEKDGRTQKEIAEIRGIQPATLTKTIQRMEKTGFLKRKSDETDKRVMRVYLTEKGKKIEPSIKKILKDIEEKTFISLSFEEKIILKRIFYQIYNNLNS